MVFQTEPDFVSRQTTDARRFYLNLNPSPEKPLTVVCGGVERMRPNYVVDRTDFPYFAIELVMEGQGSLTLGSKDFPLSAGVMFAYGPGIPHRIRNAPPNNMRKYYLDLAGPEVANTLQRLGLLANRPITIGRFVELVDLWRLIDREARENGRESNEICESLTRVLLLKIQQRTVSRSGEVTAAFGTYELVRESMERRFLEFRTIEDVATAIEISPIYLSRLFHRFAGVGAYRFLLKLRMNHAAELLLEHKMRVKDVAEELNYADAFQFSRAFKRIYGVAPSHLLASRKQ